MAYILITGGAGFIGSHLAEYYLEKTETNVVILDNFNDYYSPDIKRKNISILEKKDKKNQLIVIEGDIRDKDLLTKVFSQYSFSVVFHLAAMAGVRNSIIKPELYYDVNGNGVYDPPQEIDLNGDGVISIGEREEPGYANADQIIWWVMNDVDDGACLNLYGSYSIGLELQVTAWSYNQHSILLICV